MSRRARVLALCLIMGLAGCSKSSNVTAPPNVPAQWTRASGIEGSANCAALAVSGSTFLAGTIGSGVFRSTDGGLAWTAAETQPTLFVNALGVSGANLVAGTNGDGVFRSTDGGVTWVAATTQPTALTVLSFITSGTTLIAGTLGGGVFRSIDGGITWAPATTQPGLLRVCKEIT